MFLIAQPKTYFHKLEDILPSSGWIIISANKEAVICRHYKVLVPHMSLSGDVVVQTVPERLEEVRG